MQEHSGFWNISIEPQKGCINIFIQSGPVHQSPFSFIIHCLFKMLVAVEGRTTFLPLRPGSRCTTRKREGMKRRKNTFLHVCVPGRCRQSGGGFRHHRVRRGRGGGHRRVHRPGGEGGRGVFTFQMLLSATLLGTPCTLPAPFCCGSPRASLREHFSSRRLWIVGL